MLQAMKNSDVGMPVPDEHYILDDNKYVADILQDFKAAKGRDYQSKILFKKRMFRETDETITEPQFVTLSYVQVSRIPAHKCSSCRHQHCRSDRVLPERSGTAAVAECSTALALAANPAPGILPVQARHARKQLPFIQPGPAMSE
jgi:hypothetical protein